MNKVLEIPTQIRPKLGFCGIGWIGKNRLLAIKNHQQCEITSVLDPATSLITNLQNEIEGIQQHDTLNEMLDSDIEGVVIASPSALHADQALMALEKGKAVFCQKPLGRNEQETRKVVETAKRHDLLLGVDFSYRYTEAVQQLKQVIQSGDLGQIFAIDLKFHNAYGPDKSWYYDVEKSGGGCVMDLGIHLVDLLYWVMDEPKIDKVSSQLFHKGKRLVQTEVEDYATVQFVINNQAAVNLACSWNLNAGRNAIIEATFYGENGGVSFRNIDGSFYDFTTEKYSGTSTEIRVKPPDDWQGRTATQWSKNLARGNHFDSEAEINIRVARVLDLIYKQQN